jgi:hypothetical protein
MKNKSLGWPSSASRKSGFEKDVNSWISRAEAVTVRFLKYGAEFESAITSAGYSEFRVPEVVATIA